MSDADEGAGATTPGPPNQTSVAALIPPSAWDKSEVALLTWAVKWAPMGLMPLRPIVVFQLGGTLSGGQALCLMA